MKVLYLADHPYLCHGNPLLGIKIRFLAWCTSLRRTLCGDKYIQSYNRSDISWIVTCDLNIGMSLNSVALLLFQRCQLATEYRCRLPICAKARESLLILAPHIIEIPKWVGEVGRLVVIPLPSAACGKVPLLSTSREWFSRLQWKTAGLVYGAPPPGGHEAPSKPGSYRSD